MNMGTTDSFYFFVISALQYAFILLILLDLFRYRTYIKFSLLIYKISSLVIS